VESFDTMNFNEIQKANGSGKGEIRRCAYADAFGLTQAISP
jgi:hypothetical protein